VLVDRSPSATDFVNRSIRGAEHYDVFVAPFIAPITKRVVASLDEPRRMLDHGAGTGAVSSAVLARWPHAQVSALDPNAEMLGRITDPRIAIAAGTLADHGGIGPFDTIVSQLSIAFVPDPGREL
jgi:trans-aconitate methyltransferase